MNKKYKALLAAALVSPMLLTTSCIDEVEPTNGVIQEQPFLVEKWFAGGYAIQVNKGSLLGRLGSRAEMAGRWLLEQGLVHVVASDAHSPLKRTPHMQEVRQLIQESVGPEYARILLERNPTRILQDKPLVEA